LRKERPSLKILFKATAALTFVLGVVWLAFPEAMLASWGLHGDRIAVYMARRYGGLFFGYSVILWLTPATQPSPARTAILVGGAIATGLMAVVSFMGVVTGTVGPVVWSAVVIESCLAAAFTYYYFTSR
jgi:low temperature requirement protein LtrA